MKPRAVFLDRDGVLNRAIIRAGKPHPPASLEDLEILPGVAEALAKLKAAGFLLIVVTNQPDVPRGRVSRSVVEAINRTLGRALPIDGFKVCYHDDDDECQCRKPKPGMLLEAASEHGIELGKSYMIGDRWRDVEAGQRAGCRTVFVDYEYEEERPVHSDLRVTSLSEGVRMILSNERPEVARTR